MLGTKIHSSASRGEVARVSLINESQIRIILLDIEGTTTPVDFVYQTLFPYATRKLESFLRELSQDPEIHCLVQHLRAQHDQIGRAHSELQSPCNLVCRLLLEKKKICIRLRPCHTPIGLWCCARCPEA